MITTIPLLISFVILNFQQVDDTKIGQVSRPFAEITSTELIDFFLNQFLIPESDVTKLEIIDVTTNGFGPDDIVVTHPSQRAYIVEEPSEAALQVMRDWSLEDYRVDSDNIDPDQFDPSITGMTDNAAQNAMIADILRTLNRNYAQLPIRLRLERDENGFTFEMWDFDQDALQFTPGPPPVPDSVLTYDLLYMSQSDTVLIADQNLYDIIYLSKMVEDTVYLPENLPSSRSVETDP
ncbi:MAG: hypothetical protein WD267_04800 [Balneolales bacterium]